MCHWVAKDSMYLLLQSGNMSVIEELKLYQSKDAKRESFHFLYYVFKK